MKLPGIPFLSVVGPPARPTRDELAGLADAVAKGDRQATRTFISRVAPTIRGAVRAVLGRESADVDDVTQEATMGLLDALARFRGECSVTQFARRVAVLTALAARRRRATAARFTVADDRAAERVAVSSDGSPLAQLEAARRRETARRLLDDMPDVIAETLVLYFILGHDAEEIAAMTGAPVNTIWTRIRLGRQRLRRRLEGSPELSEELGKAT
jgi:RNA polymerase sigma-70 factor (ECF subfamily)